MAFCHKPKPKKLKLANEQPTRAEMDRRLLALWQEIVKRRAGYKCEYCGRVNRLQAHHIFSKTNLGTRWDIENGVCLCSGHHNYYAHKEPESFRRWLLKKRFTEERYTLLYHKARGVTKFTIGELLCLEAELEGKLRELKNV